MYILFLISILNASTLFESFGYSNTSFFAKLWIVKVLYRATFLNQPSKLLVWGKYTVFFG